MALFSRKKTPPTSPPNPFVRTPEQEADGTVAIQLSLDIGNKALFDLLWSVESGVPLLDVTELDALRPDPQADVAAGATGPAGALHVTLTIAGHWRKGTG